MLLDEEDDEKRTTALIAFQIRIRRVPSGRTTVQRGSAASERDERASRNHSHLVRDGEFSIRSRWRRERDERAEKVSQSTHGVSLREL